MSSILDSTLSQLGVGNLTNAAASVALSTAIDAFGVNTSSGLGKVIGDTVASSMPGIFRNPNAGGLAIKGMDGKWEAVHYANDMIAHQPKFKFLFKVGFKGFGGNTFYYYVQRCDKPKMQLIHQDVNYYNFRTKVLTAAVMAPMSITFFDEIGNSVNQFFKDYMKSVSGQGGGGYGTDLGFGKASSTKPYKNGASNGTEIIIEQIFANGTLSNRFTFKNPRIEQFDFDELNMDDNGYNVMTCIFNYDAIEMDTVQHDTIHAWGNTDLLRGGGTSGVVNGGSSSIADAGSVAVQSATGTGIGSSLSNALATIGGTAVANSLTTAASKVSSSIPSVLSDLVKSTSNYVAASTKSVVSSSTSTLSSSITSTLSSVCNGSNLSFSGSDSSGGSALDRLLDSASDSLGASAAADQARYDASQAKQAEWAAANPDAAAEVNNIMSLAASGQTVRLVVSDS
jgi:hypothetical protein